MPSTYQRSDRRRRLGLGWRILIAQADMRSKQIAVALFKLIVRGRYFFFRFVIVFTPLIS
jgi:hypothetical protein